MQQMSRMGPRRLERLSRREREIMLAIFALGNRASAEEIRARLADPPGAGAVRIMLTRLEKKRQVRRQLQGQRFLYSATLSPQAAKRGALRQMLDTFFGGSSRQLVASLVAEDSWSDEELAALRAEIDRMREERKEKP